MTILREILQNQYVQISVKAILISIFAIIFAALTRRYFRKVLKRIKKKGSIEEVKLKQTRLDFLRTLSIAGIYIVAIVWILFLIPGFKTFSISLLAGAGIAAIIIGLAAQKTIANIISGISISIFTPFRIGDRIKVGEDFGEVEEMNLRHTVMKTWDNRRVIIPNSIIAEKEITNYSIKEERLMWTVDIGIGYDADIDKARKIMIDKAKSHPDVIVPETKDSEGNPKKEEPFVRVTACADFSVNLKLYFWVESPTKSWSTGFALLEQIKKEFDKQGIEIPFPYRTIVYKKDLDKAKKSKKSRR